MKLCRGEDAPGTGRRDTCRCGLGSAALALAFFLMLPACGNAVAEKCSVQPAELKCEYLRNPLGLDTKSPRLGWELRPTNPSTRGQGQTAWQVQVAGRRDLLGKGQGDLWDSGWVQSDQSQLVEYAGKALGSGRECWWRVRVRDEKGNASAWSAPGRWTMGLLAPGDWRAKWIGTDMNFERKPGGAQENTLPDPWLRKSFQLDSRAKRAMVYVASVGYHELYVNGRRIGDGVLAPCVTDHSKRARYLAYDITDELRRGENVIGLWLGFSWSIFPPYRTADKPGSPIVLAQAEIELANGQKEVVATDETWKWHASPNTTTGVWDFRRFGGERYDARKEIRNWCSVELDETGWQPVKVFTPNLMVSAQRVEQNRLVKPLKPVEITEPKPGVWRVDMGQNFAGWVELDVRGAEGDQIELKWSERADQPMTHGLHSFYIIGPAGKGTFRDRFNYGVGRWIQIEGLKQRPKLSDVRGYLVRTAYEPAGDFACSNDLLNRIYHATIWTYETLSLGGYVVDCAQRERMGYGGDAHATTATGMDAFKTAALYSKWAEDWRDVQGKAAAWGVDKKADELGSGKQVEAGNLPYTAPTYWGGGGPGWSGYCVTLPWEMYRRFGDRRIVEEMMPTIVAWLRFLEGKSKDDLLRRYGGQWDFLGDWLWPGAEGVNGDTRETLFYNNCYWIYNLQTAARLAEAVGRQDLAAQWHSRAQRVKEATQKEFFKAADNSYVNGFEGYLAVALYVDLPPAALRPGVMKRLEQEILVNRKGHFWAGIGGGAFLVKELIEAQRPDLMFTMATQEDYPSWGYMLKQGPGTIWEDWEGKLSLAHSCYLHIGAWFTEGLGGIRPGSNGYKSFVIKPGVWAGCPLTRVESRFDSPYGRIISNWRKESGHWHFEIQVPPNTEAEVYLPIGPKGKIAEGSQALGQARGIRELGTNGSWTELRVGAGRYVFDSF